MLNGPRPSGGGGRGGAGRAPLDKAAIREAIRRKWRGVLYEEPENLDALTEEFARAATSFAGSLQLDSWVLDKARATSRYSFLHSRKPEHLSEEAWLAQFANQVSQFGLAPSQAVAEVESGASQGAGLAGFTERVGNTRQVQRARTGQFSREFAQQIAGLGAMGRG